MKKGLYTLLMILLGSFGGVLIYSEFFQNTSMENGGRDSLFVKTGFANPVTADDSSNGIYASRHNAITRAVEVISPAVVSVTVRQVQEYVRRSPFYSRDPFLREVFPELFKDKRYQQEIKSMGSGFIISADGYVLTNEHVVQDAREVIVTMFGGMKYDATIVGKDPTADIALLKIEGQDLPFVELGNSDDVIIGEWTIAVGNPFGLFEINNRPTVTVGVVSAVGRDFGEMDGRIYQDMIQTDAAINHGNSGGPLCTADGRAIGMNTFIYTGSRYSEGSVGIGFAIPINRINRLLDDLKTFHKVDRDFWIGIKVQNLSPVIARKLGYSSTDGVIITFIDQNSPSDKAGLQTGDIITQIESQEIKSDSDVFEVVYGTDIKVGDQLNVRIWREGKTIDAKLELTSIHESNE
jgi:serine protease Do